MADDPDPAVAAGAYAIRTGIGLSSILPNISTHLRGTK